MTLERGDVKGYDFDRMIVEFTMLNEDKVIECAISTAAMDNLEGRSDVKSDQRVDQFLRLREYPPASGVCLNFLEFSVRKMKRQDYFV